MPHELRFASAEDIAGLNPLTHASGVEMYLAQMTMAYLIKTDARGEATVPELITEIPSQKNHDISPDGKTIAYHLRKGVRWSDGAPFDADDVVFSTRQVLNPANNVTSRDGWNLIGRIDEPDKYTVVYHLSKPYGPFAYTFFSTGGANPSVLPKHLLAKYGELNDVPYNSLPVGIGPFKYAAWKRGDEVELVPNPRYFRGQPLLQRVVFKIIQDRNVVLEQMRTHELDLWLPVPPHFYPELHAIPAVTLAMSPSYFFDHLDFNLSRPVLQDPAVRRALRYAIDRPLINQKIHNGLFLLTESVVPPASVFADTSIPLVPFDIAKGNAILDAAGWKRGPDGIRNKNGLRLSLTYASSTGTPDTDLQIELIRGWWKKLGVDFNVQHYLASEFFAPIEEHGIIYSGKFDVVNFAWGGDPNQDLSNLYACYSFPPAGQNDPRYCNQKVTAAMDSGKVMYDRVARVPGMNYIQRQIAADVPIVVLDARRSIAAYNDDLTNWHPNPVSPFDNMLHVDI